MNKLLVLVILAILLAKLNAQVYNIPPPLQCQPNAQFYPNYICQSYSTCYLTSNICANTITIQPSAVLYTNGYSMTALWNFTNYGSIYGTNGIYTSAGLGGIACTNGANPSCAYSSSGLDGVNNFGPCGSSGTPSPPPRPPPQITPLGKISSKLDFQSAGSSSSAPLCGGAGGSSSSITYSGYIYSAGAGGGGVSSSGGKPASVGTQSAGGSYSGGGGAGSIMQLPLLGYLTVGNGGNGGGRIIINATNFYNYGVISARGSDGGDGNFPGGGGGGGYIFISAFEKFYNSNTITAAGGNGGNAYPTSNLCADAGGGGGGVISFSLPSAINSIVAQSYTSPSFTLSSSLGGGIINVSGGAPSGNALCNPSQSSGGLPGTVVLNSNNEYYVIFNATSSSGNFGFSSMEKILSISTNNGRWSINLNPIDLPYEFVVANGVVVNYAYSPYVYKSGGYAYDFYSIISGPTTLQSGSFAVNNNLIVNAMYMPAPYQNCQQSGNIETCQYPQSIPLITNFYLRYCPFTVSQSSQYVYSPTNLVNAINSNSLWLLTAPSQPNNNPTDSSLFQPNYLHTTGGDECLINASPYTYVIGYCNIPKVGYSCPPGTYADPGCTINDPNSPVKEGIECIQYNPPHGVLAPYPGEASSGLVSMAPPQYNPSQKIYSSFNSVINYDIIVQYDTSKSATTFPSVWIQNFSISNPGEMSINNFGFSPMVDNALANGFGTKSYIFYNVPSFVQHGIWSWNAKFANLYTTNSFTQTYNNLYYNSKGCTYKYSDVVSVNFNSNNYYIPFNEVTPNGYTTFNTPILPYILYNFSMPSPGSLLLPMYMNMSYDIFSPWNYYTPANSIEPFPIDTGSKFFVNYNGVLENSNTSSIADISKFWNKFFGKKSGQQPKQNLLSGIPGYKSPIVNGPISIAATPNNYIYVLNYSNSQNAYFLTILRLVPHGYYNTSNYQPNSVGTAYSQSEWNNNWNAYWANVIELQNASVYVVNSLNLNEHNSSFLKEQGFTPFGISVDNFGDVFITGNVVGYKFIADTVLLTTQPALVEITNTLVNNNWVEVYNSIIANNDQLMPEIAVSPTGSLIYLANQTDGGYVYVFSANNFTKINDINLAYNYYAPGTNYPLASLNIYSWLSNNGLFNQTLPNEMWNYFQNNAIVLDLPEYHHPLGLANINGYLYVLDEWAGGIGVKYIPGGLFTDDGIWFNILELRVFNSTGSNIPINPTHFNDMYVVKSCGSPYYISPSNTLDPSKCYSESEYNPANVLCSSGCEVDKTDCTAGVKHIEHSKPIYIPGKKYSCISANTRSGTYYSLAPSFYSTSGVYPPYGWILAANITGASLTQDGGGALYKINSNAPSINFCAGNYYCILQTNSPTSPQACNFNPYNLNPAYYNPKNPNFCATYFGYGSNSPIRMPINYYNGTYYPIGPQLRALAVNISSTSWDGKTYKYHAAQMSKDVKIGWVPLYNKIGFSVNFNDTVNILFPNSTPKNPLYDRGAWFTKDPITNPNIWKELITTKMNIENYTKLFGGFPSYYCYTNNVIISELSVCSYMPEVEYMNPPVYTEADAFKYLENLGSPQIMPIESALYSTSSGNMPAHYNLCSNPSAAISNGLACGSLVPNQIIPNSNNMLSGIGNPQFFSIFGIAESINSKLSGYSLIPYTYTYTVTQSISGSPISGSGCSPLNLVISSTNTVYSYAIINSTSNNFASLIEGGDTYLRFSSKKYYIPNLSDYGTIIPKNIFFNMLTSRNFTNIYVNVTSFNGLYQTIVNGSKTANFTINTYSQGTYPAFSTISSAPEPSTLFGENAIQLLLPNAYMFFGYSASNPLSRTKASMYYSPRPVPSLISLFDWYKVRLFTDPLDVYLNQSSFTPKGSTASFNARGYTRLIFVFNDRFNNTIYAPLDADIANITSIQLKVKPVVSQYNANQTTLYITGNATYFDGVKYVPLVGNSIYIYFNNNINYAQYNAIQDPIDSILCAYSGTSKCNLANPAFTSLSSNTDVITYYPQYNSMGECNPPPTALFKPVSYNCNIYGNGLPQSCNSLNVNGKNVVQWCVPMFSNGTGICTSQIGLMGIVTTDQNGNFAFTTNACGIGSASITATFYGYPYNEPITVTQPYLTDSATLYYDYGGNKVNNPPKLATFQVVNYSWSPNQTTVSPVRLGIAELSYGSVSLSEIAVAALLSMLIILITSKIKGQK